MNKIIKYVSALISIFCFITCSNQESKPNIIFIMADDLGYGDLGVNGQTKIRTPNLDQMAAEGIRFTNHYSGSPVCAPSRCVLMTGLHTGHAYIRGNYEVRPEGQLHIPDQAVTVAEVLKSAGYVTGAVGKWGLGGPGSEGHPNNQGFDYWYGHLCQRKAHSYYSDYVWRNKEKVIFKNNDPAAQQGEYIHDYFTQEALNFIKDNKDRSFFLYLPYTIPHLEFIAPEESMEEYRGKFPEIPFEGTGYHEDLPESPDIPFPGNYGPQKHPRAAYAAMITRMDRDIGKILKFLNDLGIEENTLVIFTSDNGAAQGKSADAKFFNSNMGWRGKKGKVYEGGIHVPFIARWPGKIKYRTVSDHISAFWDFLSTAAEIAGIELNSNTDGISYLPELLGTGYQKKHKFLYWEFKQNNISMQAVRIGKWKAVKIGDNAIELYDIQNDSEEITNVASDFPTIQSEIEEILRTEPKPSKEFPLFELE
jgi:arylsulfatase A